MTHLAKTKFNKLMILLPGLALAVNFGFCPMSLAAQTAQAVKEPVSVTTNNVSDDLRCEDHKNLPQTGPAASDSASQPTSDTPHPQSPAPCCIEASGKASLSNFSLIDLNDTTSLAPFFSQIIEPSTESFSIQTSFDRSPPESNILASVFKKE